MSRLETLNTFCNSSSSDTLTRVSCWLTLMINRERPTPPSPSMNPPRMSREIKQSPHLECPQDDSDNSFNQFQLRWKMLCDHRDIVRYLRNWSVSLLEGSRTSDLREFSKFRDFSENRSVLFPPALATIWRLAWIPILLNWRDWSISTFELRSRIAFDWIH